MEKAVVPDGIKLSIVQQFLFTKENTIPKIALDNGCSYAVTSKIIDDFIKNDHTIIVNSKINYD